MDEVGSKPGGAGGGYEFIKLLGLLHGLGAFGFIGHGEVRKNALHSNLDIQIPKDLKIIGYDGTYFVENYYPQLATIKQPLKDIARLSVDLLLKKIAGQEVQTTGYFLPVSLLPGKSV